MGEVWLLHDARRIAGYGATVFSSASFACHSAPTAYKGLMRGVALSIRVLHDGVPG